MGAGVGVAVGVAVGTISSDMVETFRTVRSGIGGDIGHPSYWPADSNYLPGLISGNKKSKESAV